jgi:hypothetical protein
MMRKIFFVLAIVLLPGLVWAAAPYPASTVLTNPVWAALGTVQQLADGSDIWPMTWAADGTQYTAYGDGWGFNVAEPSKLSMGFAIVDNGPTGLTEGDPASGADCQNIESNNETTGEGSLGKKPSGIIAVGSYLWLWVRNADLAGNDVELWYSSNYGVDWTDCGWDLALSTLSFVNHGQGGANIHDGFVYAVCANGANAYTAYDSMVLMRCPVTGNGLQMASQANWQYFSGTDQAPAWSSDFADRSPVFSYAGGCYRQSMSYIPQIGRYVWRILHDPSAGSHVNGEWGIYESENPYGPWRTVVHYETGALWDMYPGESGSFPVKWMSAIGDTLTLYFVSSTDDRFTVRGFTVQYPQQTDSAGGGILCKGCFIK